MLSRSDYLQIIRFGPTKGKADIIITCLHDDDGVEFLKEYPEILECILPDDREYFKDYLELDRDKGSFELSKSIAKLLSQADRSVLVLKVNVPRAIVDCNRVQYEDVFRKIWDPEQVDQKLHKKLEAIYEEVVAFIKSEVEGVPFLIDVHTMAPYTPVHPGEAQFQFVIEKPGQLDDYINTYLEARKRGGLKRPIDLLTRDMQGNSHVDQDLVNRLANRLRSDGFECGIDDPYSLFSEERIFSTQLLNLCSSGICIDIPKDLLAKQSDPLDLIHFELDESKIDKLASVISEGLVARVGLDKVREVGYGKINYL